MRLHVICRTAQTSELTHSQKQRVCGSNRQLLLRKCFSSLVTAIRNSTHDVKLTVLDDHSDARWHEYVTHTAHGISLNYIHLCERGARHSAHEQFLCAKHSDGLVYVVEDDYLHEPHAIDHMLAAYVHFMNRYNQPIIIHPYDCGLRYTAHTETQTTLYHDGVRYWRSVDKTTNTMLTHYTTFQDNWLMFETLALQYPQVLEDDTINTLYVSSDNPHAPVRVFSPIPSVAYHVGYSTPPGIHTTHTTWQHLWNQIPNWSLIQGWFSHPEFYEQIVRMLPAHACVVEIGAWRGSSTICLATCIKQQQKPIRFHCVDTWQGSLGEAVHARIMQDMSMSLLEDFQANLHMCEVQDVVNIMHMTSQAASMQFADHSVDFIMIDGAHDYPSVTQDISCWLPKMKSGSIMAGDDYDHSWPGVIQAVDQAFGARVNTSNNLWWVQL